MNAPNYTSKIWQLYLVVCGLAVIGLVIAVTALQPQNAADTPTPFDGVLSGARLTIANMDSKEWAGRIPNASVAQSHPRYEITLSLNTDVLETCNFPDGEVIERWQYHIDVTVVDLIDNSTVVQRNFYGDEPENCPTEPDVSATRYVIYRGTVPEYDTVAMWLQDNLASLPNIQAD